MRFQKKSAGRNFSSDEIENAGYDEHESQDEPEEETEDPEFGAPKNSDNEASTTQEEAPQCRTPPRRKTLGIPSPTATQTQSAMPSPPKLAAGQGDNKSTLTMKISKELHARLKVHCFKTSTRQVDLISSWIEQNCPKFE